jgi:hypothetical protein
MQELLELKIYFLENLRHVEKRMYAEADEDRFTLEHLEGQRMQLSDALEYINFLIKTKII